MNLKEYLIFTFISIIVNIINFLLYKSCYDYYSIGWSHYYQRKTVSLWMILLISISCFIPMFNICIAIFLTIGVIIEISDCSKSKIKDFFNKKF